MVEILVVASRTALASALILIIVIAITFVLVVSFHLSVVSTAKELEVVDFITKTYHPVLACGLVHLNTCGAEVHHSCGLVFQLASKVVVQCHIHSQQG